MNKENILFIPGWLDEGKFYGYPNSLDVWTKKELKLNCNFEENTVIAHSAGAIIALLNWQNNKNSKFIFFGPMIPKRNFLSWTYRWFMFIFSEGIPRQMRRSNFFRNLFWGLKIFYKMTRVDSIEILKSIPRDKVIIIRGTKDKYFCSKEVSEEIEKEGFAVIEIENIGHNWKEEVNNFLKKYLYEQQ